MDGRGLKPLVEDDDGDGRGGLVGMEIGLSKVRGRLDRWMGDEKAGADRSNVDGPGFINAVEHACMCA